MCVCVCGRVHGGVGVLSKSVNAHYGSSEPLLLIDSSASRPFGLCCQSSLVLLDGFYTRSQTTVIVSLLHFCCFSTDVNVFTVPL